MNLFTVFLIQNTLCAGISNPMLDMDPNPVHYTVIHLQFIEDESNLYVPLALDPVHISIINRYQDVMDDISLALPYAKAILEVDLEITKFIFEDAIKEYISWCSTQKTLERIERDTLTDILSKASQEYYFNENMLDEIKPKEITEKLLNTNQEKIEVIQSKLLENVFIVFAGSFIQLDENLTDFSVYNSIKNKECLISEIKNNEFFKIINKIYSKNTWKLPESYTNRILQTPEKSKKCLFHELCRLIKIFTFIFDNKELRLPDVMRNRSNYIFPDDCEDFPDDGAERKDILKETFGETPEISPFCDDLKPFLVKLKENLRSQTYISFYIYKVEDSIFNDIITKFFEEKKISKKKFFVEEI
ncbi:hypothetical protein CWI37_0929p0010 [Hamiltosporidium tvaerminnensis]|uniref:Uncharacterized protein n=1 Tax=Hamiltosporidium tvaerminnensis TaxID=1176355 RepID=A0A4Q9L046_9MICR|nr:hypothetical protein CWI37_0929p0010 [Hamiltosporidium tvaerminnensis]